MKLTGILLASVALAALATPALADDPIGKGLVMYMQMGGQSGDGATLARETGAKQAAAALGVELKAQYSAWDPNTMISQFKDAVAAKPSCIEIMGHPGGAAFRRSLPVVPAAAHRVAQGAEQPQDRADDEHDDADGPQNRDVCDETDDQQDDAEDDHDVFLSSG